jgi:hypothetical protein
MIQTGRSRVRFQMRSLDVFSVPDPSSRTMAQRSTQPLTEMTTRNLLEGKGHPARKADELTTVCEPIVQKIWESRHLTTLWAFTACYRASLHVQFLLITNVCLKLQVQLHQIFQWFTHTAYHSQFVSIPSQSTVL